MWDYATRDSWTTSHVERMRNDYANAIASVESRLATAHADVADVSGRLYGGAGKFTSMIAMDHSSEGQFKTDFDAAVERWKTDIESVLSRMKTAIARLESKLATMRDRLRILDQMCRSEDMREEEHTSVPF